MEARIFLSALVAYVANVTLPPLQDQHFTFLRRPHPFWDTFARYDSGWYYGIASQGYIYGEGGRNNLAFFPLYPTLMGIGGRLLGGRQEDYYFAGVVISWLAFASAMVMLYKLARLDLDERGALRAVVYAAVFPFAYFFGVVYSESLFLLGLVAATYAFRTRRWALGALSGAALTATRVTGVMALPGLAWIALQSAGREKRQRVQAALAVLGCGAGIGLYSAYNYMVSGTPFAWYVAITFWNYEPGQNPLMRPLTVVGSLVTRPQSYLSEAMAPYDTLNTLAALGALSLVPLIWRRFGFGYVLIVAGGLLLPMSSGQLEGLGRYASVQFPIALALGSLSGLTRHGILLTGSAVLYVICLSLFTTVHPLF
jgi:hypothetical protein